MADLQISALPPLTGALLQGGDPFAVADLSASETKKISALELATGLAGLFPAGSIPSSAVTLTIGPGSITSAELAAKAVTAAKLDDGSTAVVAAALPAAGAFIGQLGFNSGDDTLRIWDGSVWQPLKAAGSVNSFVDDTGGTVRLTTSITGGAATLTAELADTTAARQFYAGPTNNGGTPTARQIVPADLPSATATEQGAVQVGGGLAVTGGVVSVDNTVVPSAPATYGVVEYNAFGLVTSGRAITSADLPRAAVGQPGAIDPGSEFTVDGTGELHHANTLPAGTAAKVTYDAQGHITAGASLVAADIPNLDASKITTGALPTDRLADRSVTADKLSDYALAFIQEAVPTAGVGSHPIGMTWLQESTGQVSVWNGNSWMKTGASTLFNRNLRYCGTFDATTATITGVTQFGTAEGFNIGDTIPAADDKQAGVYFVCSVAGSSSSLAGGAVFDAGDWVLNQGTAGGWVRIDTLSGGGGGSTVSSIGDLLDVTLTTPAKDQILVYTSGGQWVNKPAPGGASTTPPSSPVTGQLWTDTSKSPPVLNVWDGTKWVVASGGVEAGNTAPTAPTTGQLWTDTSKTPPVVNVWDGAKWVAVGSTEASETVKGIIRLATTAEVDTGTDTVKAVTPKTLADNYLAKNIATLAALP